MSENDSSSGTSRTESETEVAQQQPTQPISRPQKQPRPVQAVQVPRNAITKIGHFNLVLEPEAITKAKCSILNAVFRNHPFRTMFYCEREVPEIYVQQIWYTIQPNLKDMTFRASVDKIDIFVDLEEFRKFLELPAANAREGLQDYEPYATNEELFGDIRSMGYDAPLQRHKDFNRKHLPHMYATIFSVINRCLSAKNTGHDKSNKHILLLFQGVVFDKHYDYARLILQDFLEAARKNKGAKFIPHHRFLSFMVYGLIQKNLIPALPEAPKLPIHRIKSLQAKTGSKSPAARLPNGFLRYAKITSRYLKEYISSFREPMRQSEPIVPTQGSQPREGEGPSTVGEQDHVQGEHDREEQRENSERGMEEEGRDTEVEINTTSVMTSAPQENRCTETQEPVAREAMHDEVYEDNVMLHDFVEKEVGGFRVDVSEGEVEKRERLAREEIQKKCQGSKQATSSRAPTSWAEGLEHSSELFTSFGPDTTSPVVQMHTPPSHSESPLDSVSILTRGLAHNLPLTHSEFESIEIRGPTPSSTSFLRTSSLEAQTLVGTHPFDAENASFFGSARTTVVTSSSDVARGSVGNPASVYVSAALSAGPTTATTVVSTVSPSKPGVTGSMFATKSDVENLRKEIAEQSLKMESFKKEVTSELKGVKDCLQEATKGIDEIKRHLRGKAPATEAEPQVIVQTQTAEKDLSINELKGMLMVKILSTSDNLPENLNILDILRSQTSEGRRSVLESQLEEMNRRLRVIEESCKSQALELKRKHDDHDHDHHEGEKRQRMETREGQHQSPVQESQIQEQGSQGQQGQGQGEKTAAIDEDVFDFGNDIGRMQDLEIIVEEFPENYEDLCKGVESSDEEVDLETFETIAEEQERLLKESKDKTESE